MAITTGSLILFDSFIGFKGDGTIDLDDDAFRVGLSTSVFVPNKATMTQLSDITNEVVGSGYARQLLAAVTWTEPVAGFWMFDASNPVFTASGGSITARWWWMYDDTTANDLLVAYGLLDVTPADVTTADGNTLTVQVNGNGFFRENSP